MGLRDLTLPPVMTTSTVDLIREFYVPALSQAISYDRGVGFFSSSWLRLAGEGLVCLAENGGVARLVASPILSVPDWEALKTGSLAKEDERVFNALRRTLGELERDLSSSTLSAISWMVADGLLEFKLALPKVDLDGDFHDKFGLFRDSDNDCVAFHGSPNDSQQAFRNYESIDIYCSWLDIREKERVNNHAARFQRIWDNQEPNLEVFSLPRAIREDIVSLRRRHRPYWKGKTAQQEDRWRHQDEATAKFIQERRGILEMATGTGKTRTALKIMNRLHASGQIASAIVTAFGTDLLDQWHRELIRNNEFLVYRHYERHKELRLFLFKPKDALLLISREALSDALNQVPTGLPDESIIVCDEVHGMGSEGLVRKLDGRISPFSYRLGLSATPERDYDHIGNVLIENEIGPVIYRFGLADAIRRRILCEFDYVPLRYAFSDEDRAEVRGAYASYHARIASGEEVSPDVLYQQLARVRKLSKMKIPVFRQFLATRPEVLQRCIIFVETVEYGILVQRVLLELLGNYHTYYGEDDRENLSHFASGKLDCLLTCKRISEGIDIKSTNNIILFSSARARLGTIQRIGRCLRINPDNPSKRALVVDFIRSDEPEPEESGLPPTDEEREKWLAELAAIRAQD